MYNYIQNWPNATNNTLVVSDENMVIKCHNNQVFKLQASREALVVSLCCSMLLTNQQQHTEVGKVICKDVASTDSFFLSV